MSNFLTGMRLVPKHMAHTTIATQPAVGVLSLAKKSACVALPIVTYGEGEVNGNGEVKSTEMEEEDIPHRFAAALR